MGNTHAIIGKAPAVHGDTRMFGEALGLALMPFAPIRHRDNSQAITKAGWQALKALGDAAKATSLVILLMLALVITSGLFASGPAHARQACGDRAAILEKLAGRYSEAPQAMGLSADGTIVEVLVSPSGSWTILISHPNRLTCLAANGKHWETIPKIAVGPSA